MIFQFQIPKNFSKHFDGSFSDYSRFFKNINTFNDCVINVINDPNDDDTDGLWSIHMPTYGATPDIHGILLFFINGAGQNIEEYIDDILGDTVSEESECVFVIFKTFPSEGVNRKLTCQETIDYFKTHFNIIANEVIHK